MEKIEVKRFYYPSGKLHAERSFKNGVPHDWHREWHKNGVLASEVYLKEGASATPLRLNLSEEREMQENAGQSLLYGLEAVERERY